MFSGRRLALCGLGVLVLGLAVNGTNSSVEAGIRCCPPVRCCPPPPIKTTVFVCNPCTGCKIPVCVEIPACCQGAPDVCYRSTLIGNGLWKFTWCCGYQVRVRLDRCNEPIVHQG